MPSAWVELLIETLATIFAYYLLVGIMISTIFYHKYEEGLPGHRRGSSGSVLFSLILWPVMLLFLLRS
jgi:hypothetical protein